MKKLGIAGGMGPLATAYFLELVTNFSVANTDQEHIESIIINSPAIPDVSQAIATGDTKECFKAINKSCAQLVICGAEIIAMPCVEASYFINELAPTTRAQILNPIIETSNYLVAHGVKSAGIMACDGTVKSEIFKSNLEAHGIKVYTPDEKLQAECMAIIHDDVKSGRKPNMMKFKMISNAMLQEGAEVVLLASAELSMLKKEFHLAHGFLDVMEVLAMATVRECGNLREECKDLIV